MDASRVRLDAFPQAGDRGQGVPDGPGRSFNLLHPKVVAGATKTFANPALKTVLIDFGSEACQGIIDTMVANGWQYSMEQLITNRHHVMKPERVGQLRRLLEFLG